jgi:DNA-binding SARP family transcriptional activator
MQAQFGILGPVEAVVEGRRVDLGGVKPRRLLAALLLHLGEVVSVDRLIDALWDDHPPGNPEVTLRKHIAGLRRVLASAGVEGIVVTRAPGYCLEVAGEHVDAFRFERLVTEGKAAVQGGSIRYAERMLSEALGLWRGGVLADLDRPGFARAEIARLEEVRLVATEAHIDAELGLGHHREVVGRLEALVASHPFRERLCAQLMLALYRSGRQAEALAAFRGLRERLDEELGLAPDEALADLETAILRQDPALAAPILGSPAAGETASPPPPVASAALFDVVRRMPMVGRARDLARLQAPWRAVREGGRRVVLVSGEAGVGKTRLVAELASLVASEATVVVGHCDQTTLIPYQPLMEAVRGSSEVADALSRLPEPIASRLARLIEHRGSVPPTSALHEDPDVEQAALLDGVTVLFATVAASTPVLFVVEDAEGIDQASARLLRHLARNLPERFLLLLCLRDPPGGLHPPLGELLADLERRGLADHLRLEPLSEADLAALVRSRTGAEALGSVVQALWASTGGNPFFAGEVVADLAARGALDRIDESWRVPAGVRDVLRERLRTLPPTVQDVIACAAVLGREVDFALLSRMAEHVQADLVDALEVATNGGWLVESDALGSATYAFRHPLMREAITAELSAPRRQQLHLRAAEALEAQGLRRRGEVAAAAVHLRSAGRLADPVRAAEASLRAADAAAEVYAWDETIAHAEAAVAILADEGAPRSRQGDAAVQTARLLDRSGRAFRRAVHHLESALTHYGAARDEAAIATVRSLLGYALTAHHEVMDVPRALACFSAAEASISSGMPAFELHYGKAQAALYGLRTEEGSGAAERALEIAGQLGRADLVSRAQSILACHCYSRGEVTDARDLIDDAWASAQQLADPHLAWDVVFTRAWVDNVYLLDPRSSETWCRRALAQPQFLTIVHAREGISDHLAYALASRGELDSARKLAGQLPPDAVTRRLLLLLDGEWQAADASWAAALASDLDNGDLIDAALNACWLGQVRRLLGHEADALAALRQALAIALDGPHVPTELMARAELVRLLAATDEHEATQHLARCDDLLATGQNWCGQTGVVELSRGIAASTRGLHDDADAAHAAALDVFTALQLPWKRAETLWSWARCCAAAGWDERAEDKRVAALRIYDELNAPPWRDPLSTTLE